MTQMSAQHRPAQAQPARPQRQHRGAARRQRQAARPDRGAGAHRRRAAAEADRPAAGRRRAHPQGRAAEGDGRRQGVQRRPGREAQPTTTRSRAFARGEFDRAAAGFGGLLRRFPASGYRESALFWLGNAQYAQARVQGGDRDLPQPGRERARQPARARGAARHRQLPGRAEGHQGGAQDDRRAAQDLSEVGSRAGRTRAAGVAAMTRGAGRRGARRPASTTPISSAASAACAASTATPATRGSAPPTSPSSASAASARGRPRRWRAAASPR